MSTRPAFVLHLGAHRTGTSSLQAALDAQATTLAARGIVALTPPRIGERRTDSLRELVHMGAKRRLAARLLGRAWARARAGRRLAALIDADRGGVEPDRVILSDETLLGPAFRRDGTAFYPKARARLDVFRDTVLPEVAEVHLTLRAYDSFLVSVYAMRAVYAGGMPPFAAIGPRLVEFATGWPELVDGVAQVWPKARLVLSTVEDSALPDRLDALLGGEGPALASRVSPRINRAPSLQAVTHANRHARRGYDPDALVEAHAAGTPFDPLSDADKARLRARYGEDLATLRARGLLPPG